jgi:hypothetical protein
MPASSGILYPLIADSSYSLMLIGHPSSLARRDRKFQGNFFLATFSDIGREFPESSPYRREVLEVAEDKASMNFIFLSLKELVWENSFLPIVVLADQEAGLIASLSNIMLGARR